MLGCEAFESRAELVVIWVGFDEVVNVGEKMGEELCNYWCQLSEIGGLGTE